MKNSITTAPPYALIYISDPNLGDSPEQNGDHVLWTDSAVTITCLNEQDGDTTITLGHIADVTLFKPTVFDREIATPGREIIVSTVELKVLLRATVPSTRTRVRIWENHPSEPDDIVIGLG